MHLIIEKPGSFLGKHSERLRVSVKGEVATEAPLLDVEHVLVLSSGVSLSADAVQICAENGVPISFLSRTGHAYARLLAPGLTGTVRTRREQLLAYADGRGTELAKAFARGKLLNQANQLKYMSKYRKTIDTDLFWKVRDAAADVERMARYISELPDSPVDELRPSVLNLEGRGAHIYWQALATMLPAEYNWPSRETRGASDLVNMALNYGYGVLYAKIEGALILAGLDPYAGFLHVDRAGKPSMVLDAIEEFRAPVVDRTVFGLLNRGIDLSVDPESGRFDHATRRMLAEKVLERLDTGVERYEGKKHRLRTIIQSQAGRLATTLRGESRYTPFVASW